MFRKKSGHLFFLSPHNLFFYNFIVEAEACAAEGFGEFVHLSAYRLVNDAGVDLRGGEFGVAQHLAD